MIITFDSLSSHSLRVDLKEEISFNIRHKLMMLEVENLFFNDLKILIAYLPLIINL